MAMNKIGLHDLDDSVFDGIAREDSVQEVLEAVSGGVAQEASVQEVKTLIENLETGDAKESSIQEVIGVLGEVKSIVEDIGVSVENSSGSVVDLTDDEKELVAGNGFSKYSVGDVLKLHWGGVVMNFVVAHKGYKTSGKIVLVSETVLPAEPIVWAQSANNYSSSRLRGYLNNEVFSGFAPEIQAAIVETPIVCHNNATAVTCTDKVWAPSYAEAGLGTNQYAPVEGSALSYFNSAARRSKGQIWWLRTPDTNNTNSAWRVITDGTAYNNYVTDTYGVVPCFEI